MGQGKLNFGKRKPKLAYIEYNLVHDEIQPTILYLGNRNGLEVDFYIQPLNRARQVFCLAKNQPKIYELKFDNPNTIFHSRVAKIERNLNERNYSHAILGTEEPHRNILRFIKYGIPNMIVIVHNPKNLHEFLRKAKLDTTHIRFIVLADFLITALPKQIVSSNHIIFPYYCGTMRPKGGILNVSKHLNGPLTFVVQGNVHYKRRNYMSLIKAVENLKNKKYKFKVILLGRITNYFNTPNLDGLDLIHQIKNKKLSQYFEYFRSEIDYTIFFDRMSRAQFIIPLIDPSYTHKYFQHSATSSIAMGIAFGCIPIINNRLKSVYDIDFGFSYHGDNLCMAMERCIISGQNRSNYLPHYKKCIEYRNKKLEIACQNFRNLIRAV